jgi:hypothetical protein
MREVCVQGIVGLLEGMDPKTEAPVDLLFGEGLSAEWT